MTWRAVSGMAAPTCRHSRLSASCVEARWYVAAKVPVQQGLTLVHFSAQREHIVLDTLSA